MTFLREVNTILEKIDGYKPITLPYSLNGLEPIVNRQTTDFHYNDHYKGYVKKLNVAMGSKRKPPLIELVKDIKNYNEDLIKQGIKKQKLKNFKYVNDLIEATKSLSNQDIETGGFIFGANTNPTMAWRIWVKHLSMV